MKKMRKIKLFLGNLLKMVVIAEIFLILVLCEIIFVSDASFHDFFTNGKTSFFENEPANITRRIVVDDSAVVEWGGVQVITFNLINMIAKKRSDWHFLFLYNTDYKENIYFESDNVSTTEAEYVGFGIVGIALLRDILNYATFGLFRDQITQLLFYGNVYFNKNCCDLFFDPSSRCSLNDYSLTRVSIIHDMIIQSASNIRLIADNVKQNFYNAIKNSKQIITVSEASKNDIMRFYGIEDNDFVKVIPTRLANRFKNTDISAKNIETNAQLDRVFTNFKLHSKEYLIYPSVVRPYKNHIRLIKAFVHYCERNPSSNLKLVIVGVVKDFQLKTINKVLIESVSEPDLTKNIESKIVFTNFVSDETLNILLSNALAMIFPSLHEGFGMPVIEAMAAGIPVACSNVTSLPEVAGDAALFFNPYNVNDIETAIEKIVSDVNLRDSLTQKGYNRAKYYSNTDAMIDEYIEVFEKCMTKTHNSTDNYEKMSSEEGANN